MSVETEVRAGGGPPASERETNGAAAAAILAAGIGSFAIGLFVILNELDIFGAPSLYGPAGGVSGRTTFGIVVWLVAWGILHSRWKDRQLETKRIFATTLILIVLSLILTFPPFWGILGG